MRLTEFRPGDNLILKNSNTMYTLTNIGDEIVLCYYGHETTCKDIRIICNENFEIYEKTYTTGQAMKMIMNGKKMKSCMGCIWFIDDNMIMSYIIYRAGLQTYSHNIRVEEILGEWTEVNE